MGSRGFKEIVSDRRSIPTFVMMGAGLAWLFVSPVLKSGLYALFGV